MPRRAGGRKRFAAEGYERMLPKDCSAVLGKPFSPGERNEQGHGPEEDQQEGPGENLEGKARGQGGEEERLIGRGVMPAAGGLERGRYGGIAASAKDNLVRARMVQLAPRLTPVMEEMTPKTLI